MKKHHHLKLTIAALGFMFLTNNAFAFSHPPKHITRGGTASAPFDGGISLLVAAGIGYASKKGFDKRKKSKETPDQAI
ncbi:MAG TPA: hypothetical protein VF623_07095 [Segetibacter sp.]|jgi:hypothetical protein